MSDRYDEDGHLLIRQPDGDLVPVIEPEPRGPIPEYPPEQMCGEHGDLYGYRAARCPACWADVRAGDRLPRDLGRRSSS